MKKLIILALAFISSSSLAGEMCDVLTTVNGRATWVSEPCSLTEHQALCYEEKIDSRGWTSSTAVPCPPGKQKTIEQIHREEEAAQKRKCGKDYMTIRIGMSIGRLEDCHGAAYVTDTVSKDGIVETYRTMFDWVYVKNGRVIGYTKRKF